MHSLTRPLPLSRPAPAMHGMQRGVLRRRMHTLGMADTVVDGCTTIGELQVLAKPYYRAMARYWHPDHAMHRVKRPDTCGRAAPTSQLRAAIKTYTWLMALDPAQRCITKPPLPAPMIEHEYPDISWGFNLSYHP